jgi:hypothetical protein
MIRVWTQEGGCHGCGVVVSEKEVRRLAFVAFPAT